MAVGNVYRHPNARLLIFAKAPVPGQVKSRLIPAIGEQAAAELHRLMTLNVVSTAACSALCPVELWCSPDSSHELFHTIQQRFPVELRKQQGRDLGERMFNAASDALQEANSVVIIGSDCLQYTPERLGRAMEQLSSGRYDVVITPAQDGGYVLLGMNRTDRRLFENIPWGGSDVLKQTRITLTRLQWRWRELPTLRDIDVKADLLHMYKNREQYNADDGIDKVLRQFVSRDAAR